VRVYLPATPEHLRGALGTGQFEESGAAQLTAFAVTAGLREWYVDDDIEELEYAAALEAARASLRMLSTDPSAPRRRVVVAVDVAESAVTVRDDLDRGVVRVTGPIPLTAVASVHIDDKDAEAAVEAAAEAIGSADLGDTHAQDLVDDAEGFELSWYAGQEIAALLDEL
jgi:hypothetical protein